MRGSVHLLKALLTSLLLLLTVAAYAAPTRSDFRKDTDYDFMKRTPKFHLLITANSSYDNFPDLGLPGVSKDAASVRELFAKTLDYDEISGEADQEIQSYKDFFQRQLPAVTDKIDEGDVFVFYFSGHGFSYRNQNYIVPKQFPATPANMLGNAIKITDIVEEIAKRKRPSAIILIIDACRTDIALPAEIDRSFDRAAFSLLPANAASPSQEVVPDPRQYTVIWYPTGPLGAAIARQDSVSPFTQAFVNAVTKKSKDWEIAHSVPSLAEAIQDEYNKLTGGGATKTIDHIETTNRSTAIPNLKVSDEQQAQSEKIWAQSIYSAREQICLSPIRDFMLNYPWSRSRLAAQTGLNKWLGVFGTTDCVQRSQVAQSACALSEGVRSGAFEGANRIVVAPKRIPVSPVGPIVCEANNVPNPDAGFVATGSDVTEARSKLVERQLKVALDAGKTWDSLVLTNATGSVVADYDLQAFADKALKHPVTLDRGLSTPTERGNATKGLIPFTINDTLEVDADALRKAYETTARYRLDDIAKIQLSGSPEELFVRLAGNSDMEPVDLGKLLKSETVPIEPGDVMGRSYLPKIGEMISALTAGKYSIFFVSVEYQSPEEENPLRSTHLNNVLLYLSSNFKVDSSRVVSSQRTSGDGKTSSFTISVFGI